MKKFNKIISLLGLFAVVSPLAACGGSGGKTTILRVLNMEDYIYTYDPVHGYDEPDFKTQFEDYMNDPANGYTDKYGKVKVVYDTTDTNETLYSEMQTGKAHYDLICPSDYMIQKLIMYDLIEPLDFSLLDNYTTYGSPRICERLNEIEAKKFSTGETVKLKDYAVGYMWGTLGVLFNPGYKKYNDADQIISDMQDWATLWDKTYKGTISVKDSMRDTYAVGIMYTYQEELTELITKYKNGEIPFEGDDGYYSQLTEIFNRCEKEQVQEVKESLMTLKKNIFGLEVDSGKQDIVTGKIGINLAWSGDAVYSMDQAEDPKQVGKNIQTLTYSVPETGSNIWFDAWVMPKTSRTEDQFNLAHEFLNFMCNPEYAAKNMDYTGYTSFIGGDDILDLVRDWYDVRTDEIYEVYEDEYCNIYTTAAPADVEDYIWYSDLIFDGVGDHHDSAKDGDLLYFFYDENGNEEIDDDEMHPVNVLDENDEVDHQKTYGELLLADTEVFDYDSIPADFEAGYEDDETYERIQRIDLTYFFDGTLDDYGADDMIFYGCGNYLPYCREGKHNTSVGRQFFVQFPDATTMERCAVMRDYGKNNEHVMKMWEEFRSNGLPVWSIVLFILEILVALLGVGFIVYNKSIKKKLRKKRKVLAENK